MRIIKRLLMLTLVVGVIMVVGFGWKHSPAAGLISDDGRERPAASEGVSLRGDDEHRRPLDSDGLNLAEIVEVAPPVFLQAIAFGGVFFVDKRRRQRQPRIRIGATVPTAIDEP